MQRLFNSNSVWFGAPVVVGIPRSMASHSLQTLGHDPVEMPAVSTLSCLTELVHVGGTDGRAAPPPLVAMVLHLVNSLSNGTVTISTPGDIKLALNRPSWIRGFVIKCDDEPFEPITTSAMQVEGMVSICCRHAANVSPLLVSRTLKSLTIDYNQKSTTELITGLESLPTLTALCLEQCPQLTSVTSMSTSQRPCGHCT